MQDAESQVAKRRVYQAHFRDIVPLLKQPLGYLATNGNIEQEFHGAPAMEIASTASFATRARA
jgi:hypothetical protein